MPRTAAAFAAALMAVAFAQDGRAQDQTQDGAQNGPQNEAEHTPTAEEMIDVAREAYRPPGMARRCLEGAPGEIVVCATVDDDSYRVSSPTDDAIAAGTAMRDGVPRAPAMAPPPCDPRSAGCFKFGQPAPMPPMFDYDKIPKALTPDAAARVFRAEDVPPEPEPEAR